MRYSGELQYDDGDIFIFEAFIIHEIEKAIGFNAITTWNLGQRWKIDSTAFFNGEQYETQGAYSVQLMNDKDETPCQVVFTFVKETDVGVEVSGYWDEAERQYQFKGTLVPKD